MEFGIWSLLPPLIAIVLAVITKRVILPLGTGVLVGAILLAQADPDASTFHFVRLFVNAISDSIFEESHVQALVFSLLLGAMVGVLEVGGSMKALVQRVSHRIRSRCGAQTVIAASGLVIFFDDYSNTLLVGGTMRGTADRYGVSRAKLAYLVDSTAAPVAGLSVVSTWAATEITYMADGLNAAGVTDQSAAFEMFIQSIPYRFYPCLALVMVFYIAITGRDFGPMRTAEAEQQPPTEQYSAEPPELSASEAENAAESVGAESSQAVAAKPHSRFLWLAAVLPIVACLVAVAVVLVRTGLSELAGAETTGAELASGWVRYSGEVLGNGDSYLALMWGGAVGLVVAALSHVWLGGCRWSGVGIGTLKGALQMLPAMLILWLAWALSAMTEPENLDTGGYLASVLSNRLDPRLLPTIVFIIAGAIAFSTGTSWGTMAILTPLSITMALAFDPAGGPSGAICLATCGSVLAGAIFGDHCSPISDTTVLSSRASGCDHIQHVRTQMPYALTVGGVCIVTGSLPAALGVSPWWCLFAGALVLLVLVRFFGSRPVLEDPAIVEDAVV